MPLSSRPSMVHRSLPSNRTVPAVGRYSCSKHRPVVVFPHPLSPTSPSVSPRRTTKLTSSTALMYSTSCHQLPRSGFIHRRILPVPARSRGGRLTERTPAAQPWRRERVKVPHSCHSQHQLGSAQLGGSGRCEALQKRPRL